MPHFIIALGVIAFYLPILVGKVWAWDDAIDQHYANIAFAVGQIKEGVFPWWNPFCFGGMVYAGDMQTCLFYPLNWLLLLPQAIFGFSFLYTQWYVVLHLIWMGIGQYLVLRDFKFGSKPCIIGALGLALSGHITGHFFHFIIIYVAAWMPWAFYFFRKTLRHKKYKDCLLATLCLGLSLLGGFAQYAMHFYYFLGAYLVFHIYRERSFRLRNIVSYLALVSPIFIFALGLAVVQFFMTVETVAYSPRAEMTFEFSAESTMWPGRLISFLIPNFYGAVNGLNHGRGVYWGEVGIWMHWEAQLYVGLPLLVFAILGISKWKSSQRYFFAAVVGLVLLAALAKTLPVYKILFHLLPGMDRFRGPARSLYYVPFCLSVLGAAGIDFFLRADIELKKKLWRVPAIMSGIVGIGWLLFTSGFFRDMSPYFTSGSYYDNVTGEFAAQFMIMILFAGLLFLFSSISKGPLLLGLALIFFWADLYRAHGRFNHSDTPPEQLYRYDKTIDFFRNDIQNGLFRVNARTGNRMLMNKNQGMVQSIQTLQGNNQMRPMKLIDMETSIPVERCWDLYNVKYGISCDSLGRCGWAQRRDYLPRFWFAESVAIERDTAMIFQKLSSPDFPYKSTVFLQEDLPDPPVGAGCSNDEIQVLEYRSDRIRLRTRSCARRLLVASEHYFPAWKASVDGRKTTVYCVDRSFRGVVTEAGDHEIEFFFSSDAFRNGGIITLFSWILIGAGLLFHNRIPLLPFDSAQKQNGETNSGHAR